MCGIWTSIGFDADENVLNQIKHRGPDGSGWVHLQLGHKNLCLGHRRLAIQDTSDRAAQPMASSCQNYWLTFNGEIYNFHSLRNELKNKGYRFKTNSDTEVLLYGYIHWGKEVLNKLNGMFSFVIFDRSREEIFAARDRFGVKPLFLYQADGNFAIASEIKQFIPLKEFIPQISPTGLLCFLNHGYSSWEGTTLFEDVVSLKPGHMLSWSLKTEALEIHQWYFSQPPQRPISTENLLSLLSNAVNIRMNSDVQLGALLSGGIDSSTIVALASQASKNKTFTTFTSWAEHESVDERVYSRSLIKEYNCKNVEAKIRLNDLEAVRDKLIWHQEEPFRGFSVFAEWNLYHSIKNHTDLKVILDGQGADELFCGYYWMLPHFLASLLKRHKYISYMSEIVCILRNYPNIFNLKTLLFDSLFIRYPKLLRLKKALKHKNTRLELASHVAGSNTLGGDFKKYRHSLIYENIYHQLQWQDRSSMAFSIESRQPFLDFRLIEYALEMPESQLVKSGLTKHILRKSVAHLLPSKILNRKQKFGFPAPGFDELDEPFKQNIRAEAKNGMNIIKKVLPDYWRKNERHFEEMLSSSYSNNSLWLISNLYRWQQIFNAKY